MRTARSATSGENFGDFLIMAPFSIEGASTKSGAVQSVVWPGLVVEETNIKVQVSALRKIIGSDVVSTIPGHGYRFVAALA
jgi:hypothetical protein